MLHINQGQLFAGNYEITETVQHSFFIYNKGNQTLDLISISGEEFRVIRKGYKIAPNDSMQIFLQWPVTHGGDFTYKVRLVSNDAKGVHDIRFYGHVGVAATAGMQECVTQDKTPVAKPNIAKAPVFFYVYDSITRRPVSEIHIFIKAYETNFSSLQSGADGFAYTSVAKGFFEVSTVAEYGYAAINKGFVSSGKTDTVYLPLIPSPSNIAELPKTHEASVTDLQFKHPEPAADTGFFKGCLPAHVVLLIDVSKSMKQHDRLPVLKKSMKSLVNKIRMQDSVSLITFSSEVKIYAEALSASGKVHLLESIDKLEGKGQTMGKKGIAEACSLSQKHWIPNGRNLIILGTDGAFELTGEEEIAIRKQKQQSDMLILMVGNDSYSKKFLQSISGKLDAGFISIERESDYTKLEEYIQRKSSKYN